MKIFSHIPSMLVALLFCLTVTHGDRSSGGPIVHDYEESKTMNKFQRFLSGLDRVQYMIKTFMNPSLVTQEEPTTLQVQFAGLGRTGTTSLTLAMNILGYHVLHDDTAQAVIDLYAAHHRGE